MLLTSLQNFHRKTGWCLVYYVIQRYIGVSLYGIEWEVKIMDLEGGGSFLFEDTIQYSSKATDEKNENPQSW